VEGVKEFDLAKTPLREVNRFLHREVPVAGVKRVKILNADGSLNSEAMTPTFGDFQDMYVDFYRFISVGAIMGSPAVDKGVVYVGSTDGNLYALK
jgi:hypothetical protein